MNIDIESLKAGRDVETTNNGRVEIWRVIRHPWYKDTDYPTCARYVSTQGRVMKNNGEISYGQLNNYGYRAVGVNYHRPSVHQLVAFTFYDKPVEPDPDRETYTTDHVDGNRQNNDVTNLRFATQQEQMNNRGTKAYSKLCEGEERVLMAPSTTCSISRKKARITKASAAVFYDCYILSDEDREHVSFDCNIKPSTAVTYISQHYKASDAPRLEYKLGLNKKTISEGFKAMELSQEARKKDKSLTANMFTPVIHNALGPLCTDPELAAQLVNKLYHDICE